MTPAAIILEAKYYGPDWNRATRELHAWSSWSAVWVKRFEAESRA